MGNIAFKIIILFFALTNISIADNNFSNSTTSDFENEESSKVLSRTKRFLVFPDGSSFQLVFCTQNMGYLQLDIVWFGTTAALAWELPTDPNFFYMFKNDFKYQRRQDVKHVVYFNEDGRVVAQVPYRRKPIVNPAFAKRSIDDNNQKRKLIPIKEMHERHKNKTYFEDLDVSSTEFHREGRKSLYSKLETFFEGLGLKGKECVLRLLCDHAQSKDQHYQQGSFLQEIMKATFSFPKSHQAGLNLDYDIAHSAAGNCAKMYPNCDEGFLYNDGLQ